MAYEQSYKSYIPHWQGVKAGQKYAEHVIDTCTEQAHPDFRFLKHRSSQYRDGFLDGYDDSVSAATNSGIPMGLEAVKKLDKQFLLTYLVS
ncbi:MAG: hypothetical protein WCC17_04895 [Candidatus Nitrosopolaris sp.]